MTAKQQIAFVCHPYHRGGVTGWMRDAAIESARQGHEVYFVTVDPLKPFQSGKSREKMVEFFTTRPANFHLVSAPVDFSFEFGSEDFRATIFAKLILDHVPAGLPLIISDDRAVWRAAAAVADKYKVVGVLHGDQNYYYDIAIKYQQHVSLFVCVSGRIRKTLAQKCPQIAAERLFTIPCGIDLPAFAPVTATDETIRLIFVGRLTDYEKRAEDLVKIAALLVQQGRAFHLDIVGNSDSSAADFGLRFQQVGASAHVTFHGWQPKQQIQELLNRAAILLLTSNSEGMPLVMMEALASGCGFVGTRVSGIEDYESNNLAPDCIRVYTVGEVDDAMQKIMSLAVVPPATRHAAARKLSEAEFSMQVCLDKYFAAVGSIDSSPCPALYLNASLFHTAKSRLLAVGRYLKVRIANK